MIKTRLEGYKMTYRFNASHTINSLDKVHTHTFWVKIYIRKDIKGFFEFADYENKIVDYFAGYRRKCINDFDSFKESGASLENMCRIFFKEIGDIFESIDEFSLVKLELGDSPIKSVSCATEVIAGEAGIYIDRSDFSRMKELFIDIED